MTTEMANRHLVIDQRCMQWAEGTTIRRCTEQLGLGALSHGDHKVVILSVPADGVDHLEVNEMGRILVYGPKKTEAAAQMALIYDGPWNGIRRKKIARES